MRILNVSKRVLGFCLCFTVFFTAGCMYPGERKTGGMEALPAHVDDVQRAVERYRDDTSVLPIKTVEADTPLYQKYVVDFGRLIPQYVSDAPPSAFEKGGSFMYVLLEVENNPTVKLFDLRVSDAVQKVQQEVDRYRDKQNRLPQGGELSPGVFVLDDAAVRAARQPIPSPYSEELTLPFLIDSSGTVYVDYRGDLTRLVQKLDTQPPAKKDIRYLLTNDSLFVPAHSLPYKVEQGEVVPYSQ
ncbi:hypothetical protein [Numidum massiliense]|uniref:hypothetical protein n=1 Tax=Numidum massiliense TaxID=1522315 RepID=UPI0006D572BB|nr:hypothetical protein [Numidum massiliense]